MDSKNTVISGASGGASASVRDALGNVIASSYIADVSWDSENRILSCLGASGNVIGSVEIPSRTLVDDVTKPLMFRAVEDNSSVTLNAVGNYTGTYLYSRNNRDWSSYTYGTSINLNAGKVVYFKVDSFGTKSGSKYCKFVMTGAIEAWHNVNSMVSENFASLTNLGAVGTYTLVYLFRDCASLVKAPLLPATSLAQYCYSNMFSGCTGLTQAPVLPNSTAVGCFSSMFEGCTGLTQVPTLPSSNSNYCFSGMFKGCTGLTSVPTLPGAYSDYCYNETFMNCTGLTQITIPSVLTARIGIFSGMYAGCTGITQIPTFEAPVYDGACAGMFEDCTGLTDVSNISFAMGYGGRRTQALRIMFRGCTSLVRGPASIPTANGNATYSADNMCYAMFSGCTALTQAPLCGGVGSYAGGGYASLFENCSSLSVIRCIGGNNGSNHAYTDWTNGVAPVGDLYCGISGTSAPTPTGWYRHPSVTGGTLSDPLMLQSSQDNSTVTLNKVGNYNGTYLYSTNRRDWSAYTFGTTITLKTLECVYFKVDNFGTKTSSDYCKFSLTGMIYAFNNVASMVSSNFENLTDLSTVSYALYHLFDGCTKLQRAPLIPFTNTGDHGLSGMFYNSNLTEAPSLSSITTVGDGGLSAMFYGCLFKSAPNLSNVTTIGQDGMASMFNGCTSLASAPSLAGITSVGMSGMASMFYGCTTLSSAPNLSNVTSVGYGGMDSMFRGCTSLKTPPNLSGITTVGYEGMKNMFYGCTSLLQSPTLSSLAPSAFAYASMFYGCGSLSAVTCLATDVSAPDCTTDWLNGVAASGDFYTPQATNWGSGASGIPADWVRHDI